MDTLIYWFARVFVAMIQALPLTLVARLGRAGGGLAYWLDARHRRVALRNLTMCFGNEKSPGEIRALARENFRRLGENYASAIKTAAMSPEQLRLHFSFTGAEKILPHESGGGPQSRIVAIGHFGNFELYARFGQYVPVFKCATTYRALNQPKLNRLLQSLRERSGCWFFERRTEGAALRGCMSDTGLLLGLLADQSEGRGGLRLPFLGHDCATTAAPAIFALRYRCPLHTAVCYRVRLAKWEIEAGDEIPTRENGAPRSTEAIMREKFPGAYVAVLCPEKLRELWPGHSAVNETISFAADENVFAVGKKLRAGNFDLALVLPNSPRSAIETWIARIPQRIGLARPRRNFFLTQPVAPRPGSVMMRKLIAAEIRRRTGVAPVSIQTKNKLETGRMPVLHPTAHQIHDYLHLVAALGANPEPIAPQLFVTLAEIEAVKKKFGLAKFTQPILGLNPGAEYGPAKRWPLEKFIAAAREIQNRTHCTWLVFGSQADAAMAKRIESAIPSPPSAIWNLAGKTSLRELMALLKLCRVLLTNDSGPMHVAAALGTPVVVPFGSTSPELTGPGLPGDLRHRLLKSDVPCSPCFRRECPIDFRCMTGIAVERVVNAVLDFKL
jgi:lipopolysaccharide heptosyltransferase II